MLLNEVTWKHQGCLAMIINEHSSGNNPSTSDMTLWKDVACLEAECFPLWKLGMNFFQFHLWQHGSLQSIYLCMYVIGSGPSGGPQSIR